jgi:hypothetical protein
MENKATGQARTTVSARIIHADGSVTDLGELKKKTPWYKKILRGVFRYGK